MSDDLCFLDATELTRRIAHGDVSAVEVMRTHLERIDRMNPA
jgi:amidase